MAPDDKTICEVMITADDTEWPGVGPDDPSGGGL